MLPKLNDKIYIGITKIFPYPHSITISKFNNFEDLYNALKASQFIPFFFGYPVCFFRNKICTDGFFTNKKYEPFDGRWFHINIYDFNHRFQYRFFNGLLNFNKLTDYQYHNDQFNNGYIDARNSHNFFLINGLIEK